MWWFGASYIRDFTVSVMFVLLSYNKRKWQDLKFWSLHCRDFHFWYRNSCGNDIKWGHSWYKQIDLYIDELLQKRCNSSALVMELHLSCTNPSMSWWWLHMSWCQTHTELQPFNKLCLSDFYNQLIALLLAGTLFTTITIYETSSWTSCKPLPQQQFSQVNHSYQLCQSDRDWHLDSMHQSHWEAVRTRTTPAGQFIWQFVCGHAVCHRQSKGKRPKRQHTGKWEVKRHSQKKERNIKLLNQMNQSNSLWFECWIHQGGGMHIYITKQGHH